MAIKTISVILGDITAAITTNANNEITGAVMHTILTDLTESLNALISRVLPVLEPAGTTQTIDWKNGTSQVVDLKDATGNVTITFSNPLPGTSYLVKVIQDATTPRDLVYPGNVKWALGTAPVISIGALAEDLIVFFYDGTNYYGSIHQDLS